MTTDLSDHPPFRYPDYRSTIKRSPDMKMIEIIRTLTEETGPGPIVADLSSEDADLTTNAGTGAAAIGERIIVTGKVLDTYGGPLPKTLIEIWQANAGGKYRHGNDKYMAALDPNFGGGGRVVSDADGAYSFRTIRPGPYPFPNDGCAWRPAHIHLSIFGHAFVQRLVTQLYFEGDPLIQRCVIVNTIKDPRAIDSLVSKLDMDSMQAFDCLAYRFDIVLRGRKATPFAGS